jgi:glutamine synthetase
LARDLFDRSKMTRSAFDEDMVAHYMNMAEVEIDAFEAVMTDWERMHRFERL